jgi:hypothetical protein
MSHLNDDLDAMIQELRAQLPDAPPEMRPILEDQIKNLQQTKASLARAAPAMEENKRFRAPLSPEAMAFFRPEAPAPVPAWLPDDLARGAVAEPMLRCPQGAQIYAYEDSIGCAVPQGIGNIPIRHGLQLAFYKSSGRLSSQSWYEGGLLRWSIEYHPLGARSLVGFYADVERLSHLEHGLHTSFAPNGTITAQTAYVQGIRHGWTKLWEDDGYPIVATLYDRGRAVDEIGPEGRRPS